VSTPPADPAASAAPASAAPDAPVSAAPSGWRAALPPGLRAWTQPAALAAFFLGVSSGFPIAMVAATLTTRLAQDGLSKSSVTAFGLVLLMYNAKLLWAPVVERVRLPLLGRLGQRRSWLILAGLGVMAATIWLGVLDPKADLGRVAIAALMVAFWGATYDIVIDGYRTELLSERELGVGAGMSQYGWRTGNFLAGSTALLVAATAGWAVAYAAATVLALPAIITGLVMGEPANRRPPPAMSGLRLAVVEPLAEFFRRQGALLVLAFVLVHKIGDTLANLSVRLLLNDLGFSNAEIAVYDVGVGLIALLVGIFVGGLLYTRFGLKRTLLWSLVLMAVSNLSFAWLATVGKSNAWLAFTFAFENFASGIGGVAFVAYISALANLSFTATQFALLSAAASVLGRVASSLGSGRLIELMGYVDFYLLTTVAALPGILLFWLMMRRGLIDRSLARPVEPRGEEGQAGGDSGARAGL
jgi:PAT family beta-lactamase induction signal transducer AmpG